METIDLFENIQDLPENIYRIIMWHSNDDNSYYNVNQLEKKLNKLGYTFEYGLDAIPFNLKKI